MVEDAKLFWELFFLKFKVKTNASVSVTEKTLDGYIRTENFLKISLKQVNIIII